MHMATIWEYGVCVETGYLEIELLGASLLLYIIVIIWTFAPNNSVPKRTDVYSLISALHRGE